MRGLLIVFLAAGVLPLTACGTTVDGAAVAPSISSTAGGTSAAAAIPPGLNTGLFPTTPYRPLSGHVDTAWVMEGNRMLNGIVLPTEVDPQLTEAVSGQGGVPALSSLDFTGLSSEMRLAFTGAKVGVSVARADSSTAPTKQLTIGLYRFVDKRMQMAAAFGPAVEDSVRVKLRSVQGSNSFELTPGTIDSILEVGDLVLHVHTEAANRDAAIRLAQDAFAEELPVLHGFVPTPAGDVLDLPVDRDGIMTRTLGLRGEIGPDVRHVGFVTSSQYEKLTSDPRTVPMFRAAGVDLFGWNVGVVARARDAGAAVKLRNTVATADGASPIDGIPQLADQVLCTEWHEVPEYRCYMAVGRYYARVASSALWEVREQAAAQWIILTRHP